MSKKKINIFIPHYGEDEKYIPKLKKLLKNKNYDISDSSIVETNPNNAQDPDYIKKLLRPKIDWAGTILVLIGPKTHERSWVNWEIEYAATYGDKRIIGVYLPGASDSDDPEKLGEYGDACVAWDSDKLVSAIEGENIWYNSEGQVRPDVGIGGVTC
jgi:hypothetical protein